MNVLTLFFRHGRGYELSETLEWIYAVLKNRAYLDGTMYYHGGDTFLFFLSRMLMSNSIKPQDLVRFKALLAQRIMERTGAPGDALALSLRILAGSGVGVYLKPECARLCAEQQPDGSFPTGFLYKYAGAPIMVGNKGMTTAFALAAIKACDAMEAADF